MPSQPVILSHTMVTRALADPRFHSLVPEFRSLRTRQPVPKIEQVSRGCSGCRRTQVNQDLYRDFIAIMLATGPEIQGRVKAYFGVPGLMMNVVDPKLSKVELKIV